MDADVLSANASAGILLRKSKSAFESLQEKELDRETLQTVVLDWNSSAGSGVFRSKTLGSQVICSTAATTEETKHLIYNGR